MKKRLRGTNSLRLFVWGAANSIVSDVGAVHPLFTERRSALAINADDQWINVRCRLFYHALKDSSLDGTGREYKSWLGNRLHGYQSP
jgi:hypothetical protein